MKTKILWLWGCGLVLAVLPFVPSMGGIGQELTNSGPNTGAITGAPIEIAPTTAPGASLTESNANSSEQATIDLENAPGEIVLPAKAPATIPLSAAAAEIVRLAQAGVDESVMLAYITNSAQVFRLTSDEIIYLTDVGVPSTVVTAMIQRDEVLRGTTTSAATSYADVPAPGAPTPYPTTDPVVDTGAQPPTVVDTAPPAQNVSYTYFYSSLAPYGSWINISGYGLCWQPTVVVSNPGWRPYLDRGRWVYSDCGWYWASDYSWGWAPFHYGRWFNHSRWGWCWAPDTVWAPSWVSWRYTRDYCSWAPLPPSACYTPGFGFSYFGRGVGFNFTFGLTARHFTCVPINRFHDRHLHRHRLSDHHTRTIVNNTVVNNTIVERNRTIVNEGVPVDRVAAATRTEIRRVNLRNAADPERARLDRGDRDGRTLSVFRPNLPTPTRQTAMVGQGVRPASRQDIRQIETASRINNIGRDRSVFNTINNNRPDSNAGRRQIETGDAADREARDRRVGTASRTRNQSPVFNLRQNDGRGDNARPRGQEAIRTPGTQPPPERPATVQGDSRPNTATAPRDIRASSPPGRNQPLILRGNRSDNDRNTGNSGNQRPNVNRSPVFNQPTLNPPLFNPRPQAAPQAPVRNNSPQRTMPQRPSAQPRAELSVPAPAQSHARREQPQEAARPRNDRAPFVSQRHASPVFQTPIFQAAQRENRSHNPASSRSSAPSRAHSAPAPRVENRQAAQHGAPQRSVSSANRSSSGNQGSRHHNDGGGNNRRNR